jgi:lactate dehydrogenase-like 2-hydroxyacid dehydrogenase
MAKTVAINSKIPLTASNSIESIRDESLSKAHAATILPPPPPVRVIRMAVFDSMKHEKESFEQGVKIFVDSLDPTKDKFEVNYYEYKLNRQTARLAAGCQIVSVFVNDDASAEVLTLLANQGVQLLTLRCAGFNNVDLKAASALGITVTRVPAYSPYAVAEFAVGLAMTLNRKIVQASGRVKQGNFSLAGLVGFDFHGKTVGVIGTGKVREQKKKKKNNHFTKDYTKKKN